MNEDLVQGSAEWRAARAGKLTASRLSEALAKTSKGWGASRANLIAELVAERLTGITSEGFNSEAIRWGHEKEPDARAAYEMWANVDVAQVGFVEHPTIAMSGASPDGFVGDVGLIEIKCPNTATHIETLLSGAVPLKYSLQMQWQMACTGRLWCDFVSFDPRMPGDMQLLVKRIPRLAPDAMSDLEQQARDFLAEVDAKVAALTKQFRAAA